MSFGLVQSGWGESECFCKNLAPGSCEVFKDILAYRNAPLDRRMNYGFRKCRGYVEMRCFGRLTVDKKFGSMTCVILLHFLTNNETF